jgi:hypothetical protein
MRTQLIDFGKVTYAPGAPKKAPRWIWKCACDKCHDLPFPQGVHGPFKTRRAAEADAAECIALLYHDDDGPRH